MEMRGLVRPAWLAAVGSALYAGCGGGSGALDAGVDAATDLCPVPEGRSYIVSRVEILPPEESFDLDGDEVPDGMLGQMPPAALADIHQGFAESIALGEMILLFHIGRWADPPTPNDDDLALSVFSGLDADVPLDPSNNVSGSGRFYMTLVELDLECNSRTEAERASIADRVLTAERSTWVFPSTLGTLEFLAARTELQFDDAFAGATGRFGAMVTLCTLSEVPFPGDTPGTVLDGFANDPILRDAISVDMDVDGDGLEEVVGDGVSILECHDGDGTVISGRSCPCHPAIADAYSVAFELDLVGAVIVGVR